jgi:hypothetical protein
MVKEGDARVVQTHRINTRVFDDFRTFYTDSNSKLRFIACLPFGKTGFFFTSCRALLNWKPYYSDYSAHISPISVVDCQWESSGIKSGYSNDLLPSENFMRIAALSLVLLFASIAAAQDAKPLYSPQEIEDFSKRFQIYFNEFYFPQESFLGDGYAPPGGYVKDFSVIKHDGRYHLFHIDGRGAERCTESGNEISFGHASTADLQHWIRHRMPIAVGDKPWDNEHVWAPFVTEWKGRFYMFYMASGRNSDGVLASASSDDLETWTKDPEPIRTAEGRDPFVRIDGDTIYLYYTRTHGGIGVVTSKDMKNWSKSETVYLNSARTPAESCSVHRLGDRWALWFNDYLHCADPSGDFRTGYVFSDDPLKFDPKNLKIFDFKTELPTKYGGNDWVEKRPIAVSMELLEQSGDVWLVAYFRWHIDRFRMFVGAIDWKSDPAKIEEILTPERLREVLDQVKKSGKK